MRPPRSPVISRKFSREKRQTSYDLDTDDYKPFQNITNSFSTVMSPVMSQFSGENKDAMKRIKNSVKKQKEYEAQRQKAKDGLCYLYASMFCVLWGRSFILPILKFYADAVEKKQQLDIWKSKNAAGTPAKEVSDEWFLSPEMYSLMVSVFYVTFLISSYYSGKLANCLGRRATILTSLAGMSIGFLAQALSFNYWILFAARAWSGLFCAIPSVCQTYIADVAEPSEIGYYQAILGAVWGACWASGPLIAVALQELVLSMFQEKDVVAYLYAYRIGFFFAAFLNLTMFFIAYIKLEESADFEAIAEHQELEQRKKSPVIKFQTSDRQISSLPSQGQSFTTLLVLLLIAGFFGDLGEVVHMSLYPKLQDKASGGCDWNTLDFAFIFCIWGGSYTLIQFVYPWFYTKFGVHLVNCISNAVASLSLVGIILIAPAIRTSGRGLQYLTLWPLTIINGIGYGIWQTGAATAICELSTPLEAPNWLGWFGLSSCLGDVMAYPMGNKNIIPNPTQNCFWVGAGGYIVAAGILLYPFIQSLRHKTEESIVDSESDVLKIESQLTPSMIPYREQSKLSLAQTNTTQQTVSALVENPETFRLLASAPLTPMGIPMVSPFIMATQQEPSLRLSDFNLDGIKQSSIEMVEEDIAPPMLVIPECETLTMQRTEEKENTQVPGILDIFPEKISVSPDPVPTTPETRAESSRDEDKIFNAADEM